VSAAPMRGRVLLLAVVATALAVSACAAHTTPATDIRDYAVTLHATGRCDAGEVCKWYFEYWPALSPRLGGHDIEPSETTPVQGPVNGPTGLKNVSARIRVFPGTTYRWVFCGSPNNGATFVCSGPNGTFGSTTADPPPDFGTFTSKQLKTLAEGWNGSVWFVQRTRRVSQTIPSEFSGVSCTSPTACTAVGREGSFSDTRTLAERWDGTSWTVQPTAAVSGASINLASVSCPSPSACVAVGTGAGFGPPLAEHWDGTTWTTKPTVDPRPTESDSLFSGVSCTSATACTAVGATINNASATPPGTVFTLAERWNGSSWTVQPTPNPGGSGSFKAVSCTSATSCFAVGFGGAGTLAAHWNGSTWTVQPTPSPGSFNGVSCTSDTACTAVGSYFNGTRLVTVAARWNGSVWTAQTTPNTDGFSELKSVSCSSATSCTAVGDPFLAEHWDGTSWTIQPTPSSNPFTRLAAVSCSSGASCTAVGQR
jgi:hypothetical protein